jgi:lipid-binding SYLF domain-containing protein
LVFRLPYSVASEYHDNWSPPWFIKITGMEWGAVVGVEKISALVGVMSERALKELTTGSKVALGSDYSIAGMGSKK